MRSARFFGPALYMATFKHVDGFKCAPALSEPPTPERKLRFGVIADIQVISHPSRVRVGFAGRLA